MERLVYNPPPFTLITSINQVTEMFGLQTSDWEPRISGGSIPSVYSPPTDEEPDVPDDVTAPLDKTVEPDRKYGPMGIWPWPILNKAREQFGSNPEPEAATMPLVLSLARAGPIPLGIASTRANAGHSTPVVNQPQHVY